MKKGSLVLVPLLLGVGIVLLAVDFYLFWSIQFDRPLTRGAIYIIDSTILTLVLVLLFICWKVYRFEKSELSRALNSLYSEHLQELLRVVRLLRHDFANHVQVISALLQTNQIEKAKAYITSLGQRIRIPKGMLQFGIPELGALLMVKMHVADLKNISFDIEVDADLKSLKIDPLDLNTIIGNLLDNAFEAVEGGEEEQKRVVLRFFETPESYFIQTINPGYLDEEMREKIFSPGFSTKQGSNRGFGLVSAKTAVEKYRGRINVACSQREGVKFTVIFPKMVA